MFVGKYEWSGDREAGDCSIRILDASEVDDGEWECQVTASAFTAHDALTSRIAELVVRVAPNRPQLEVETQQVLAGQNFTVQEDQPATIKCISHYGNPPADIKWFIGKYVPEKKMGEINFYASYGIADVCKENLLVNWKILWLSDAPTVTLEGAPSEDIEEGVDDVSLRCLVDSNPAASVVWRVLGETDVFSFLSEVRFSPATRKHSATYTCEARNSVGGSYPISVNIDVKYGPRVLQVGPAAMITAALHNHTLLECLAEGNPPPMYTWLQTVPDTQEKVVRGHNATLLLEGISYEHQGQYTCVASSVIKSHTIEDESQPITVEVVGAPQVLRYTVERNVLVEKGQDAVIQIVFCSDPQPSRTSWEWGSLQLEAGNGRGRYVAENLAQDVREDCYSARLRVQGVDIADARDYVLNVENDKGADRYAVGLLVNGHVDKPPLQRVPPSAEPVSMSTVIGIVIACLVVLVLVTLIILYAFKTEKWCFSQRGDFKPTDLESDKSDIESQKGNNGRQQYSACGSSGGRSGGKTPVVAGSLASIPPDALYSSAPKHTSVSTLSSKPDHEYENLKIMPTQMVTPNLCQEMRSSSNSQSKKDEHLLTANGTCEVKEEEILMSDQEEKDNSKKAIIYSQGEMQTFKKNANQHDECKVLPKNYKGPKYVPVYRPNSECNTSSYQNELQTGTNKNRKPNSGVVYAELQLPRASNNGSMRRANQHNLQNKTHYAEITFQGCPLQTAEI
nr:basement membrane-specific heparan sulfate proteoglycan core protein-like [Cherax quadricarinatus]